MSFTTTLLVHANNRLRGFRMVLLGPFVIVALVLSRDRLAAFFELFVFFHAFLRTLGLRVVRRPVHGVVFLGPAFPAGRAVWGFCQTTSGAG